MSCHARNCSLRAHIAAAEAAATSIRAIEAKAKEAEEAPLEGAELAHWATVTPWLPPEAGAQPVLVVTGLPVPLQSVVWKEVKV
jgi:hypothetical protein